MSDFYTDQREIMDNNIGTNTLLPYHATIPSLNKKLKTVEQQSLIKAINEVRTMALGASQGITTGLQDIIALLGDKGADPSLADKLAAIGPNIIEGLFAMNDTLKGLLQLSDVTGVNIDLKVVTELPTVGIAPGYVCILQGPGNLRTLHLFDNDGTGANKWFSADLSYDPIT